MSEAACAVSMASNSELDSDRDESVFTDCPSGNDSAPGVRKWQTSVPEMVKQVESKRAKRQLAGNKSRSPRERARPRVIDPSGAGPAHPEVTLQAIQQLIEAGNAKIIEALEARFAHQERRIEILESECHEKDVTIIQMRQEMATQSKEIESLRERIDGIDMNRRLSSLILTCDEFGQMTQSEDIELMTVRVINRRFPDMKLTTSDLQIAHRLPGRNKVIAKFVKRAVRDELFERRFELAGRRGGAGRTEPGGHGTGSRREMAVAALYINESLIPENQRMYSELLAARRQDGGARVASVFSRRGHVFCRKERGGENIRVRDWHHLQSIIRGEPCPSSTALAAAAAGRRPAGRRRSDDT